MISFEVSLRDQGIRGKLVNRYRIHKKINRFTLNLSPFWHWFHTEELKKVVRYLISNYPMTRHSPGNFFFSRISHISTTVSVTCRPFFFLCLSKCLIGLCCCFSRLKIANFDFNVKCQQIAEATEGLSGREISKIAIAWQVSV